MSLINSYATLTDFKSFQTISSTDATDDSVIEKMLEGASRWIDSYTGRRFYPIIATRYFDVPQEVNKPKLLQLDDDLLALTTLTNGDDTTITSTDYLLQPVNASPKWGIQLKPSSDVYWEYDSSNEYLAVIDVLGWWGYHDEYSQRAWSTAGTLGAALNASALSATMTAGHTLQAAGGQILKIDNEIIISTASGATSLTILKRGDNGSTAAAHDNASTVYLWNPMAKIHETCLEVSMNLYRKRYGENSEGVAKITAMGVVISPTDVSSHTKSYLDTLKKLTWL
jgi:hypothetical protein